MDPESTSSEYSPRAEDCIWLPRIALALAASWKHAGPKGLKRITNILNRALEPLLPGAVQQTIVRDGLVESVRQSCVLSLVVPAARAYQQHAGTLAALSALETAVHADPCNLSLMISLARRQLSGREWLLSAETERRAKSLLVKICKLCPGLALAQLALAHMSLSAGRVLSALTRLRDAVEKWCPLDKLAIVQLLEVESQYGEPERAAKLKETARLRGLGPVDAADIRCQGLALAPVSSSSFSSSSPASSSISPSTSSSQPGRA